MCNATQKSIIVDAPMQPNEIIKAASTTNVESIIITHNHYDHIEGIKDICSVFEAPVLVGQPDAEVVYSQLREYSTRLIYLRDNHLIRTGNIVARPIYTPGHTKGSTCIMLPAESPAATPHLFSGDTLFPGGPGRTTSHNNLLQIIDSIKNKLLTLPNSTVVLPGHGEFTTIAKSKLEFEQFQSKKLSGKEMGEIKWIS